MTNSEDNSEPAIDTHESFDFAGWGSSERISDLCDDPDASTPSKPHLLGQWASTAICGNDITSSCLYVSGLAAAQAGALAPITLAVVAAVLFLFRFVYAEVGSALPLNGGTYTVLLNTTNKKIAAAAAVLTLLSYVATAVISAGEAMHYAHNLWAGLPVFGATIVLLAIFAALNLWGIAESAVVALGIFVFHMGTLVLLSVVCGIVVLGDPSMLLDNWSISTVDVNFMDIGRALFFGFAAAMLGISGFESSANFIEEQKPGVFPKTLRNMWVAVSVFNPLMSVLSLGVLPLVVIQGRASGGEPPPDLLAQMGNTALHSLTGSGLASTAGTWLGTIVSVDAVLVLSGAVLTSFVGVTGLMRRMSLDRCLPQFLLAENKIRGTNHWIIIAFFAVSVSILAATKGVVSVLAGVYTLSFLAVMSLFAIGNMMLKVKRGRLPRETKASWPTVVIALLAVLAGLVGNVIMKPEGVRVFALYAFIFGLAVALMFLRMQLMRLALFVMKSLVEKVGEFNTRVSEAVLGQMQRVNSRVVVYFTRGDDPALLNRAALYVIENEQTHNLKVVHVYENEDEIPTDLAHTLAEIDHLYPNLRIDFLAVQGRFGPSLIEQLGRRLDVPLNYMFIGTPGDRFPHRIAELGGVRLIL